MLFRKIEKEIKNHLKSEINKILVINGARQIGKSFIIRKVCKENFSNYCEINLLEDKLGEKIFSNVNSVEDFYLSLSLKLSSNSKDTVIFLDEIQEYPNILPLLKFLNIDNKYKFICSGSLLGVTLAKSTSIPMGSILVKQMYQLDFEEFIIANGISNDFIVQIKNKFNNKESLDETIHNKMIDLFKKYLIVGGLPDSVNAFLINKDIKLVRQIQSDTFTFYSDDASKYDLVNNLKIKRIYNMIPSILEQKKKRLIIQDIENIKGKRFSNYIDSFDYLINSGIALEVKAISNPKFPLIETSQKNLLKLYLNDIGILTNILYSYNIKAIIDDSYSVNLGNVYESVVAQELNSHGYKLFYYDNKSKGEIDYLINDESKLEVVAIEVKSGKDYKTHSAMSKLLLEKTVDSGVVLSNNRVIEEIDNVAYYPIYMIMFFNKQIDEIEEINKLLFNN